MLLLSGREGKIFRFTRQGHGKNRALRYVVKYLNTSAVGLHKAAAQGQPKPHASAAIAIFYGCGVEHVKNAALFRF
jgi:hypothetical protein